MKKKRESKVSRMLGFGQIKSESGLSKVYYLKDNRLTGKQLDVVSYLSRQYGTTNKIMELYSTYGNGTASVVAIENYLRRKKTLNDKVGYLFTFVKLHHGRYEQTFVLNDDVVGFGIITRQAIMEHTGSKIITTKGRDFGYDDISDALDELNNNFELIYD